MNAGHLRFLASPEWAQMLQTDLLPWLLHVADLGDDVLEVGPGPGLTTDLLRRRTAKLTAVEVDTQLASALSARLSGTNVEVIHGDATNTGLPADRFSAATCFSMLHHMPGPKLQDQLFMEVCRVLRPAGAFIGTDSRDLDIIRAGHVDDVFVPVDPDSLGARLESGRVWSTLGRARTGRTRHVLYGSTHTPWMRSCCGPALPVSGAGPTRTRR